ncbi:MAG: hypothetical protein KGS45_07085 [Planctomycetes bacterium]|nr:hypothetical protein [Planctomycetota bacterium]
MGAGAEIPPSSSDQKQRVRARRIRHWTLGLLVALCVGWFLFAQSPLTPRLVLPPLARLLGVGVSADGVSIGLNGVVAFDRLRFTLPDEATTGPASVLAEAKRATGKLKLSMLASGRIRLSELVLIEPTVRVSQSLATGKLNLGSISGSSASTSTTLQSGSPEIGEIPTIVVSGGAVLLGEHDENSFTLLRRVDVDGTIEPIEMPSRGFAIQFHEVRAHDAPADLPTLDLRGTLTEQSLALDLTGFSLDAWPSRVLPGPLRTQVADLQLAGRVNRASLRYDFKAIPAASLDLQDVAVTLPVTANVSPGALPTGSGSERLRMTRTSGTIELTADGLKAKIVGQIEDVPYTADLTTTSTDPDGPFSLILTSTGYELSKNPPLRRFLNETVKERLRDFGNPTGMTTTIATITRGPKTTTGPGEITTKGQLKIENGVAAFHKFPYEFRSIQAILNFTENAIEIESLRGTAPSGATIFATGTISPLTDGAEVKLDIITKGVPIDETLEKAMKPGERLAVQRMFSREDHARIRSLGLLPADQSPQAFPFRGICDITIRLTRDLGDEGEWHQDIRVNIPKAGLIAAPFPLPAVANNLRLLIGDDAATVDCDDLRPITGGSATLHASVDLAELRRGGDVTPNVTIHAKAVPIDDLARQAIVMAATRNNESGRARIATLVNQSHLSGKVDATVQVSADTSPGALAGDIAVEVRADGYAAAPYKPGTPDSQVVHLRNGWAILNASDREVDLAIGGALDSAAGHQMSGNAKVRLVLPQRVAPGKPARSVISASAESIDLGTLIETPLDVFSADAAAAVREQRVERAPIGKANLNAQVAIDALGGVDQSVHSVRVVASDFWHLSLLEKGQRLLSERPVGSIEISQSASQPGTRIQLVGIEGQLVAGDPTTVPAASFALNADFVVSDAAQGKGVPTFGTFAFKGFRLQFESSTLRAIANAHTDALQSLITTYDPAGFFDLELNIDFARPLTDPMSITGTVMPREITINSPFMASTRVPLKDGRGTFAFNTKGGQFQSLGVSGSTWSGLVNGNVTFNHIANQTPGVPRFENIISASGTGTTEGALPDDLRAVLPEVIRDVLTDLSISLDPESRFSLESTKVNYTAGQTPAQQALSTSGTLTFVDAKADVGIWLKGATGSLAFVADRPGFDQPATWSVDANISKATAAKIGLTNLTLTARNGSADGDVLIPTIAALCHGGRIAGSASIIATPDSGKEPVRNFECKLQAGGVGFAPVLADLKVDSKSPPTGNTAETTTATADTDASRGILDGDATIRGIVGDPKSRSGRGTVTVGGGRILPSSGLMQLIRISNLQFPSDEPLDLARANWFLAGPVVNFEELSVASRSVSIVGYGTMTLPEMALDLRFDSRSARRIPVISKVIEMVRDQLITTRVRGTADNPKFEVVPVPFAGRAVGSMSGSGDQVLERLRQEADARRDRDQD